MKNKLFKDSVFVIAASMFVNVVNYFYHLIFGRFLGPADYGVLASLYSLLYIVSIVPQSTSFAIVKFVSSAKTIEEKRQIYESIKSLVYKVGLIFSVLLIVASGSIARFMNIDDIYLVALVAPVLFFSLLILVIQATFQGLMQFDGLVIPNVISSIVKFLVGIGLVFFGLKVFGAMIGVVAGAVAAYLYGYIKIKKFEKGKVEGKFSLKTFLKFSFPVLLQSLAFTSIFTVDLILAKHYFNAHEAGLYAALSMLGKIIFFAVSPIVSVLFPEVSSRQAKGGIFFKVILNSIFIASGVCLVITIGYALMPELVIKLLYGSSYVGASANLILMAIFISLYTISYMLSNFYISVGKVWASYVSIFAAVIQVIGISVFHKNIYEIILSSLLVMLVLVLILIGGMKYNFQDNDKNQ